jgi:hydrogenase-4 component B
MEAALAGGGVALLLAGGAVALLPRGFRASLLLQAGGLLVLGTVAADAFVTGSSIGSPFTSELRPALGIDPLSGFFLLVLAVVGLPVILYAAGYLEGDHLRRPLTCLTGLFIASLVLVLTARDLTTFLAGWELMTLLPAAIILVGRSDRPVRRAVFVYLAVTHLGGVGVWVALLALAQLNLVGGAGGLVGAGSLLQAGVLLAALVGFGTKAGLVPMHSWLPRAHPVAPSHVSALMSGLMIKVAIYGLIRVLDWSGAAPAWFGVVVVGLGALSAVGGVTYALFQHELKRLLAFHSIENIGIITLGLGSSLLLAGGGQPFWSAVAFAAALLHVLNHAIFKALLFLGAGALERAAHTHDLDHFGGALRRMPWTGGSFLVGSMAIAGLPLLNGFVSEWLTFQALVHGALLPGLGGLACALGAAALAGTAALAVLCFVKVCGLVLLGRPRSSGMEAAVEVGRPMRYAMAALAALCVLLGTLPGPVLAPLLALRRQGAGLAIGWFGLALPGTGGLPTVGLLAGVGGLALLLAALRGRRVTAPAPAWTSGQIIEPSLDWTSSGFTKPIRLGWEWLLRPTRELTVDRRNGVLRAVFYQAEVPHLFDTLIYTPVVRGTLRAAAWARRLQSGSLRAYSTYLVAIVILVLGLLRAGLLGR